MSDMIKGTMISYRPDIKVLDATIRDGGLVNNFEFTDDFVRKLYLTNVRAGVDVMEIGYLADPELFEESKFGKWKFCHEDAIQKVLIDILDPKMQLAVMADVGRANVAPGICRTRRTAFWIWCGSPPISTPFPQPLT